MDELRIRQCGSWFEYCSGKCTVCPKYQSGPTTDRTLRLDCLTCAYAGRPIYDWPCTVCRPTEYGGTMHCEKE